MYNILVVDDEQELRKHIVSVLTKQGYAVDEAENGQIAAQMMAAKEYPLVLCDVKMPVMTGTEFLQHVREYSYSTAVCLITAHGNVRDAVHAIQDGAFDYLEKPITEDNIMRIVQNAERAYNMIAKIAHSAPQSPNDAIDCVGENRRMKNVFQLVERLTRVNTSVLIRGENGTGKELVARAIHYNSPRKEEPFVAVNCGAIPENLIESELFGHEKGAFTGAEQRKIGKFQFAAKGTLFLDEIGEMSPQTQVKLLRVLQDHSITPVGSNREVKTDARIIAATNRDLEKAIEDGSFREDLYYRLSVMPILLPPLRERVDDIPALVHHFIDRFNGEFPNKMEGVNAEALETLEKFNWPGNIRELENAIEHAFVVETSSKITYFSLPEYIRQATRRKPIAAAAENFGRGATLAQAAGLDWERGKEIFERDFIVEALKSNQGRINMTAEQSNIPKNTLLRKIKKYQINPRDYLESENRSS